MSFNWKSPGPGGEQGYGTNNKSLHPIMLAMINQCLNSDEVFVLVMKDKAKGREISNYRPITCLSVMWKLFTSYISDGVYQHLDKNGHLPEKQKGCRKQTRGTKDHLLIDKTTIRNGKRWQASPAIGWVDYKKAFDMFPHP